MKCRDRGVRSLASFAAVISLSLLLPLFSTGRADGPAGALGSAADPVRLEVIAGTDAAPATVELHLVEGGELSGVVSSAFPETLKLTDGVGMIHIPPPAGGPWRIRAEAPGFWSEPVTLRPEEGGGRVERLVLWPAAALTGRLIPPKDETLPTELQVRLRPAGELAEASGSQPTNEAEVSCPVDERTLGPCTVPAGRWNLRIGAGELAPHFRWDEVIGPGMELDLGRMELERGGSIFGRITLEAGELDPKRARVWARPLVDEGGGGATEDRRFGQLAHIEEPRPDGTFQLVGLTPGNYQVGASQPGYVIDERKPIAVERGRWTELAAPMHLELPLRLSVVVEPAVEPYGGSWSLYLYREREGGRLVGVGEGETDEAGFWRSPPIAGGRHQLEIRDSNGNSLLWEEIEVERHSTSARVEIPVVYVEGELLLDGEPLQGTIWFGGRTGAEKVEVESDGQGEFFAVLPREGAWTVDVAAESPTVRSRGIEVEVDEVESLDLAEVRIEVPNTAVVGRVVDERGRRATKVRVVLLPVAGTVGPTSTETGSRGEFEVHGIPPGRYTAAAETPDARSSPLTVEIAEALEPFVELVLHDEVELAGRVVSENGPVPGASIRGYPVAAGGGALTMTVPSAQTSVDGHFRLSVPAATESVRLVVKAPGYAVGIARVTRSDEVEIVLDREMGTLRFDGVEELVRPGDDGRVGLVMVDGEPLPLMRFFKWSRSEADVSSSTGAQFSVTGMPPGNYSLCSLEIQEAALVLSGAALPSTEACRGGFLSAGGELLIGTP